MQDHFTHFTPMHNQHFGIRRFDCRNKYSIRAIFGTGYVTDTTFLQMFTFFVLFFEQVHSAHIARICMNFKY